MRTVADMLLGSGATLFIVAVISMAIGSDTVTALAIAAAVITTGTALALSTIATPTSREDVQRAWEEFKARRP